MLKKLYSIAPDESDVFLFLGIGSVFFGVYQLNPPIAYIVLGVILIGLSLVKAMSEVKRPVAQVTE